MTCITADNMSVIQQLLICKILKVLLKETSLPVWRICDVPIFVISRLCRPHVEGGGGGGG